MANAIVDNPKAVGTHPSSYAKGEQSAVNNEQTDKDNGIKKQLHKASDKPKTILKNEKNG